MSIEFAIARGGRLEPVTHQTVNLGGDHRSDITQVHSV